MRWWQSEPRSLCFIIWWGCLPYLATMPALPWRSLRRENTHLGRLPPTLYSFSYLRPRVPSLQIFRKSPHRAFTRKEKWLRYTYRHNKGVRLIFLQCLWVSRLAFYFYISALVSNWQGQSVQMHAQIIPTACIFLSDMDMFCYVRIFSLSYLDCVCVCFFTNTSYFWRSRNTFTAAKWVRSVEHSTFSHVRIGGNTTKKKTKSDGCYIWLFIMIVNLGYLRRARPAGYIEGGFLESCQVAVIWKGRTWTD